MRDENLAGFRLDTPGGSFVLPWFCLEPAPILDLKQELQKIIDSSAGTATALKTLVAQL